MGRSNGFLVMTLHWDLNGLNCIPRSITNSLCIHKEIAACFCAFAFSCVYWECHLFIYEMYANPNNCIKILHRLMNIWKVLWKERHLPGKCSRSVHWEGLLIKTKRDSPCSIWHMLYIAPQSFTNGLQWERLCTVWVSVGYSLMFGVTSIEPRASYRTSEDSSTASPEFSKHVNTCCLPPNYKTALKIMTAHSL